MPVDEKRALAVFLAAVEFPDPAQQAAIVSRECGSDAELQARVESLLKAHRETTTVIDPKAATPIDVASPLLGATIRSDSPIGARAGIVTTREPDQVPEPGGSKEEQEPVALDFLEPSSKPGSLGRLGHHEVLEVLGRGGFGVVVRAFDETLHRIVAIKVLAPELAATSPARKRFLREARASARVRHANVVHIYAVEEKPLPYLVMEYIPGQSLQQRLDEIGPLEVPDVLRIGGQIARGLAAAHEQGLIHRDIKPANILLEDGVEPKVKITDFGLARAADDASLSQSGVIAGTPLFMAPEQAKGEPPDPRADLFSLGSVLYTMTSGRPPFRAASAVAVLKRVAEDTPRPIRQIIPEVPGWLCNVISKLHAKDPAERFQSAAEVAGLLEQHLAHLQQPSLIARPDSIRIPRPRSGRRMTFLAVAGAMGLVSLAAIAAALWRPRGGASPSPELADASAKEANQKSPLAVTDGPRQPPPEVLRSYVLQGGPAVRDALINFSEPTRRFGDVAQDNAIRRAEQCNAFLVWFDLTKLELPPRPRVEKATVSFFVWDPSSKGKTEVCAFPLKTAWDEATVSWREPAAGKSWKGGQAFSFEADAGPPGPAVVVNPEQGGDTADPPIEYQLDVTDIVRSWMDHQAPNNGLAIAPVIDPAVDQGILSRFQIFGTEHDPGQYTPKLTVIVRQ
jgi:serine/threonine protein kinase